MITLVTEQKFKFGQKNIIPFAGEVNISSEGEIEVEDAIASQIVAAKCGFDYKENKADQTTTTTTIAATTTTTTQAVETTTTTTEQIAPQTDQDDLNQGENNDLGQAPKEDLSGTTDINETTTTTTIATTTAVADDLDKQEARTTLGAKTLGELKEMAKPFASKDWRDLNKTSLIEFLLDKTFS